ncbi:hypothetical protein ACJX0J_034981, partial [Zea mays]
SQIMCLPEEMVAILFIGCIAVAWKFYTINMYEVIDSGFPVVEKIGSNDFDVPHFSLATDRACVPSSFRSILLVVVIDEMTKMKSSVYQQWDYQFESLENAMQKTLLPSLEDVAIFFTEASKRK